MENEARLQKIAEAFVNLDDDLVYDLVDGAIADGIPANDIFFKGLAPGLRVITADFKDGGFLSDMIIAGDVFKKAVDKLLPFFESDVPILNCKRDEYSMVIGTVERDYHNIGKQLISAFLKGVGIKVIDIGENISAEKFVAAVKKYKPNLVGASTKLCSNPACEAINKAMTDAGVRDDVFYFVGGWDMEDEWCDEVGADAFGLDCFDTLDKLCIFLDSEGLLGGIL